MTKIIEFRICWKNRITGATGMGVKIKWTEKQIVKHIRELNEEFPDIEHWFETM